MPAGGSPVELRPAAAGAGGWEPLFESLAPESEPAGPAGLPRVVAIMVASADGRTTVDGRSVALGHPADRDLLRGLRARADAVLVGSRTLAVERYGALLDREAAEQRVARGQTPHPLVATISRDGSLPAGLPLLAEPGVPVLVFAEKSGEPPAGTAAAVRFEECPGDLSAASVKRRLGEHGARLVAFEGGAGLLGLMLAGGAVDDLLLTVAPQVAAGDGRPIVAAAALALPLSLRATWRADDHLFLHYRIGSRH
ncbi:MAG: dihydrofolate reductase family protein [Baekduia sp.]